MTNRNPAPSGAIVPQNAALSEEQRAELRQRAVAFVEEALAERQGVRAQASSSERAHNLGLKAQRRSAQLSSVLLERPMREARAGGAEAEVQGTLLELRRTIDNLDPSLDRHPLKWLQGVPLLGKLVRQGEDQLKRFESAQEQLDAIVAALHRGHDRLLRDCASIDQVLEDLQGSMQELQSNIELATLVDEEMTRSIEALERTDPERAKLAREEILFVIRQRRTDLNTQLAVTMQGSLALEVVRRNNRELISGVHRATTTTMSALQTSVMVAQALDSQKGVLDQTRALSETTSRMIQRTSEQLRTQTAEIHDQATRATIDPEVIGKALQDVRATLDEMSRVRGEASERLRIESEKLEAHTREAQKLLDREINAARQAKELMSSARVQPQAPQTPDLLDLDAALPTGATQGGKGPDPL